MRFCRIFMRSTRIIEMPLAPGVRGRPNKKRVCALLFFHCVDVAQHFLNQLDTSILRHRLVFVCDTLIAQGFGDVGFQHQAFTIYIHFQRITFAQVEISTNFLRDYNAAKFIKASYNSSCSHSFYFLSFCCIYYTIWKGFCQPLPVLTPG